MQVDSLPDEPPGKGDWDEHKASLWLLDSGPQRIQCRLSTTRGRPEGHWGIWEDRTQIQPQARLQTCALACELCLQEGTSFSANSLKGNLCSLSLPTSKSLGGKRQELVPLSSSHKSAFVSCCCSASSLPRAHRLASPGRRPSTLRPPAATAPGQPCSCEGSAPHLRPRPVAVLLVRQSLHAQMQGVKAGCKPFLTLVLAVDTPGGTPPSLGVCPGDLSHRLPSCL